MFGKKTILLLLIIFVTTAFQGCSSVKNGQEGADTTTRNPSSMTGRFVERQIALPVLKAAEKPVKIIQNLNKQIELYTKLDAKFTCYQLQSDMSWVSSSLGWLNSAEIGSGYTEIRDLCLGADGSYYLCYVNYNTDSRCHILKSTDEWKKSKEIDIAYLKDGHSFNGSKIYPSISNIDVLENGNLVLYDVGSEGSLLIFSQEGLKIDKLAVSQYEDSTARFQVSGNNIIAVSQDNKGIIIYNTLTKMIIEKFDYDMVQKIRSFAEKGDGTILMGGSDGIHRKQKGSTLWETTVDSSLNSMSMPTLTMDKLFVIDEKDEQYFASYIDSNGAYKLMSYTYDSKISAVPMHKLTVYSLRENATIKQAISIFQSKDPDIKVDYIVAIDQDGGKTSDYIHMLNTELLSGNGADVLVLDGLPVDLYIKKGILENIYSVVKPLEDSGAILKNISDCYNTNEKMYLLPTRFSVPVIIGNKDATKSVGSMDSILGYIRNNKKMPYSNPMTYRQLLQNYLALCQKDIYINGKLDNDRLVTFLKNIKEISDNTKSSENTENGKNQSDTNNDFIDANQLFSGNILGLVNNRHYSGLAQIRSIDDLMLPEAIIKSYGKELSGISNMFIPKELVGLNHSCKSSDIAKKFISLLLAQEVQDSYVYDGFPINAASLNKWVAEQRDSVIAVSDRKGNGVSAGWPDSKEREAFAALIRSLTTPIEINQSVDAVIIEQGLIFLKGQISAEQAAEAAISKLSIFLEENN